MFLDNSGLGHTAQAASLYIFVFSLQIDTGQEQGKLPAIGNSPLSKILHAGTEQHLIFFSRHILKEAGDVSFAMAHLAQHPSIWREQAFYGIERAVGVKGHVHSGLALVVHILGSHLTCAEEGLNLLLPSYKAPFAVRYRNAVHLSWLHMGHPRRIG